MTNTTTKGPRYIVQIRDGLSYGWLYAAAKPTFEEAAAWMGRSLYPQVRILDRHENAVVASRTRF